jgi:nucleoid DNA-binding protein
MLVKAVMDAGYSKRLAKKAVDGVIMAWKRSLAAHKPIELPIGTLKVKKTPKNPRR